MRLHSTFSYYAGVVALCGSVMVEGHGYASNINIAGVDHDTCGGPHYSGLGAKECATPLRNTARESEEWVNTPLFTDLDERLATGGPDEGFPATFPNIVNKAIPAKKGDLVKIHWRSWPSGHLGPILNMMASCGGSCKGKKGASLDWFKISQESYNPQTKKWPLELPEGSKAGIDTKFTLPTNLPGGEYLLSQTLIAMHSVDGPQYYVSAFEIDLDSDGTSLPELTMKIPAMYTEHRNDVTQFPKMVDNPLCYDWGLFRVPGVPVYDKSDSIAGDSGGNGAEEFDDTPLIVPSTCSWRTETVVGHILGESAGTYKESANKAKSDAPVGSPTAAIIQPSQVAPAAPPSGSQASGTLVTSGASGIDCTSIVTECFKAAAGLTDHTASMTAHEQCNNDKKPPPAKRLVRKHPRHRRNDVTMW